MCIFSACKSGYGSSYIPEHHICASDVDKDSCQVNLGLIINDVTKIWAFLEPLSSPSLKATISYVLAPPPICMDEWSLSMQQQQ